MFRGNCDPAVIHRHRCMSRDAGIVFGKWSGARDLNPGPHGPELCDISSKNGGNDRFLFEIAAERQSDVSIWSDLFAGLLHELLHGLSSST
jgi:hypothetical protein